MKYIINRERERECKILITYKLCNSAVRYLFPKKDLLVFFEIFM